MDSPRTLVVLFGGNLTSKGHRAIGEVGARFPQSTLLGCSTAGEIFGRIVDDGTVAVAIARFDKVTLRKAALPIASPGESIDVGRRLGHLLEGPDLRAVFVLSDGLQVNGTQLAAGLNDALSADVCITGGLAGDGERFGRTWVLADRAPVDGWVSAVGLYGEALRVGHGCDAGWSSFGPERRVTSARGNVLYELDGKPALALYKSYLGDRAAGLPATALLFPLGIRRNAVDSTPLIRTVLAIDDDKQSLTFAGDIPEGHLARLMHTSTDRLIQSAVRAGRIASATQVTGGAPLALAVSCVGRRIVMGERTEEELEGVFSALPSGSGQVGFYSYGEMSPSLPGGGCELHNQTMTLTLLDEA